MAGDGGDEAIVGREAELVEVPGAEEVATVPLPLLHRVELPYQLPALRAREVHREDQEELDPIPEKGVSEVPEHPEEDRVPAGTGGAAPRAVKVLGGEAVPAGGGMEAPVADELLHGPVESLRVPGPLPGVDEGEAVSRPRQPVPRLRPAGGKGVCRAGGVPAGVIGQHCRHRAALDCLDGEGRG